MIFAMKTPITQYHTRQSIRGSYDLEEAPIEDCLAAVCCTPCAVAQDTLELEHRSYMEPPTVTMVAPVIVSSTPPPPPPPPPPVAVEMNGEYEKVETQV